MDCMSLTGTPTMSDESLTRIMNLLANTKAAKAIHYSDYFLKVGIFVFLIG